MSQPQPKPTPEERADLFIAHYQHQYSEAIHAAREAFETTGSEMWQAIYKRNMEHHRKTIADAVAEINQQIETIKTHGLDEETEKQIKGAVKAMADERIRHNAWKLRAVTPFIEAVERCTILRHNTLSGAKEAESRQPLLDRGLSEEVRLRVAKWPRAYWDEKHGVVMIDERPEEREG